MKSSIVLLLGFCCDAPFKVLFNTEQLRRPDLTGKFVEGSHSSASGNAIELIYLTTAGTADHSALHRRVAVVYFRNK